MRAFSRTSALKAAIQAFKARLRETVRQRQHHVDDIGGAGLSSLRFVGVALEDQAEGVAVEIEKPKAEMDM